MCSAGSATSSEGAPGDRGLRLCLVAIARALCLCQLLRLMAVTSASAWCLVPVPVAVACARGLHQLLHLVACTSPGACIFNALHTLQFCMHNPRIPERGRCLKTPFRLAAQPPRQ